MAATVKNQSTRMHHSIDKYLDCIIWLREAANHAISHEQTLSWFIKKQHTVLTPYTWLPTKDTSPANMLYINSENVSILKISEILQVSWLNKAKKNILWFLLQKWKLQHFVKLGEQYVFLWFHWLVFKPKLGKKKSGLNADFQSI